MEKSGGQVNAVKVSETDGQMFVSADVTTALVSFCTRAVVATVVVTKSQYEVNDCPCLFVSVYLTVLVSH